MSNADWSDEDAALAVSMYRARISLPTIAKRLGRSVSGVRALMRRKKAHRSLQGNEGRAALAHPGRPLNSWGEDGAGQTIGMSSCEPATCDHEYKAEPYTGGPIQYTCRKCGESYDEEI